MQSSMIKGTSAAVNLAGSKLRIGILGFGSLGQHLFEVISNDANIRSKMEIQYVWNRSPTPLDKYGMPEELRLKNLEDAPSLGADIVIEVSHPNVSKQLAVAVMKSGGNFVVGSPTALADHKTELAMRETAAEVIQCTHVFAHFAILSHYRVLCRMYCSARKRVVVPEDFIYLSVPLLEPLIYSPLLTDPPCRHSQLQ